MLSHEVSFFLYSQVSSILSTALAINFNFFLLCLTSKTSIRKHYFYSDLQLLNCVANVTFTTSCCQCKLVYHIECTKFMYHTSELLYLQHLSFTQHTSIFSMGAISSTESPVRNAMTGVAARPTPYILITKLIARIVLSVKCGNFRKRVSKAIFFFLSLRH